MSMCRMNKFTLVEVMLALGVLLVIATLSAGVAYSLPISSAEQQAQARRLEELSVLDRIADGVIRNAVPMSWPTELNESKSIFLGDAQLLMLAYRHRLHTDGESGLRFLALGLRGNTLVAQYRDTPMLRWQKQDPLPETLDEEIVLTGVASLQMLYADWKDGELVWLNDWDELNRNELPQAIGWEIGFEDGTRVRYLRRTAGNGYYTTWGRRGDVTKKQ